MDESVERLLSEGGKYVELTEVREELERLAGQGTTEEVMTALKREALNPPIGGYSADEVRQLVDEKEDFAVRMMEAAGHPPGRRMSAFDRDDAEEIAEMLHDGTKRGDNVDFQFEDQATRNRYFAAAQNFLEQYKVVTDD